MKINSILLSGLLFSGSVFAHDSSIHLDHAYARATPPTAVNSAIFVTITNDSNKERYLVAAKSNVSDKVELHNVLNENGVKKMRQVDKITIPANASVELKPGSFHIMLFDINQALVEDKQIAMTLSFANGETISQAVPIKKAHHGMKH